MNNSFRDEGKTIYDFLFEFYVKCPQCGKFAYVKSFPDARGSYLFYKKRVLTCDNCGCTKIYKNIPGTVGNDFPLWLESNCSGNKLWAYNLSHNESISTCKVDISEEQIKFAKENAKKRGSWILVTMGMI